ESISQPLVACPVVCHLAWADHLCHSLSRRYPRRVERSRAAAGRDLTFAIRPLHLEDVALIPSESTTGSTLDGVVDVVENLGDELLVYLTVAGRSAVAKLDPRSQVKAGAKVRLHVDNES